MLKVIFLYVEHYIEDLNRAEKGTESKDRSAVLDCGHTVKRPLSVHQENGNLFTKIYTTKNII